MVVCPQSPHEVLTAGAHVLLWDVRTKPRPTATFIPCFAAAMHAAPQLHSATVHQQQPHRCVRAVDYIHMYVYIYMHMYLTILFLYLRGQSIIELWQ